MHSRCRNRPKFNDETAGEWSLPLANDRNVDNCFCSFIGYPATLGYVEEPRGGMTPVMVMWVSSNSSAALSKINLASKQMR